MRATVTTLLAASSLVAIVLVPTKPAAPSATAAENAGRAAEVSRIRAHFDSVLVELGASDVSVLTSEQRARRAALVATLRAYRDRGAFPRNYDFPGRAVPYFVDRRTGILCAVAHLLESTGRRDIVDRVAAANNNVWVPQLARDTAFTHWLDASGITLDAAARIQVPYNESGSAFNGYTVASVANGTLAVGTTVWNATTNRDAKVPFVNVLGLLTGMTSIALGIGAAAQDDVPAMLGIANFGVGTVSTLMATSSLMRRQRLFAARREAARKRDAAGQRSGVETTVAPTFSVAGQKGAGVLVTVRF